MKVHLRDDSLSCVTAECNHTFYILSKNNPTPQPHPQFHVYFFNQNECKGHLEDSCCCSKSWERSVNHQRLFSPPKQSSLHQFGSVTFNVVKVLVTELCLFSSVSNHMVVQCYTAQPPASLSFFSCYRLTADCIPFW